MPTQGALRFQTQQARRMDGAGNFEAVAAYIRR
mgnify:CR=1 FL=1